MKVVSVKNHVAEQEIIPRTITLELTNEELNIIVAGFGATSPIQRKREMFDPYGVPHNERGFEGLYGQLRDLSDFKERRDY